MPWADMLGDRDSFADGYLAKQQELFPNWEQFFQKYGFGACLIRTPALLQQIRAGVPDELRGTSCWV
jgi:hypothetical protein